MKLRYVAVAAAVPACLVAIPLASHGSLPVAAASASPEPEVAGQVGAGLQQEISRALWGCFEVGEGLIAEGDVAGAKATLRNCFTDDMTLDSVMPPAYASLGLSTTGGADGFVEAANKVYRSLNIVHAQHLITNIVIERTGPDTATVRSGALAVHTYQDQHVFNANIKFVDSFQRTGGVWKITHRTMNVLSLFQSPAWTP